MQATFSHQPTNTPTQTKTHPHTPIHTDKHNDSHTHAHKHWHFQTCAHTLSPSVALIIHSSRCFTIIITMTSMPAPAAATVQNSGQKSLERMNELVWDQVWHFHAFFQATEWMIFKSSTISPTTTSWRGERRAITLSTWPSYLTLWPVSFPFSKAPFLFEAKAPLQKRTHSGWKSLWWTFCEFFQP